MPAPDAHPPIPGGIVQPNFLTVEEAVGDVTFPISKKDLLEQVGDGTTMLHGRNIDLHDLIKDLHDDFFESEEDFRAALEREYITLDEGGLDYESLGVLPSGPQSSYQSRVGPGVTASSDEYVEPPE